MLIETLTKVVGKKLFLYIRGYGHGGDAKFWGYVWRLLEVWARSSRNYKKLLDSVLIYLHKLLALCAYLNVFGMVSHRAYTCKIIDAILSLVY